MLLNFKSLLIIFVIAFYNILQVSIAFSFDCSKFIGSGLGNPYQPSNNQKWLNCMNQKLQKQELQSQKQFNKEMRDLIKPRNNSSQKSLIKPIPNGKIISRGPLGLSKYYKRCKNKGKLVNWCIKFHRNQDACTAISENKYPNDWNMQGGLMKSCMKSRGYKY